MGKRSNHASLAAQTSSRKNTYTFFQAKICLYYEEIYKIFASSYHPERQYFTVLNNNYKLPFNINKLHLMRKNKRQAYPSCLRSHPS